MISIALGIVLGWFSQFYTELRKKLMPVAKVLFPRHFPVWLIPTRVLNLLPKRLKEKDLKGRERVFFITANVVTIFRTLLVFPIGVLLYEDLILPGFWIYVVGGILDFVDGLVATAHEELGYKDDKDLGAFLDAFCDKFYFFLVLVIVALMAQYTETSSTLLLTSGFATLCLLCYEVVLGIVRVHDYYYNHYEGNGNSLDLRAKGSGKLKMALEMIGLGGLILALPALSSWSFWVGLTCLILAIPFAHKSLLSKLKQHNPA